MSKKDTECSLHVFSIYRRKNLKAGQASNFFSKFTYIQKETKKTTLCMETASMKTQDDFFLKMFHPQAREFLFKGGENSVLCHRLIEPIKNELRRAIWRVKAPKWAHREMETILQSDDDNADLYFEVKINGIEAFLFPTGIMIISIAIVPAFHIPDGQAPVAAKMILNTLNRAGKYYGGAKYKSVPMKRFFTDKRQQESAQNRFSLNQQMGLSLGLTGEAISIGDICQSLIQNTVFEELIGDRFLGFTFIKSPWEENKQTFLPYEYADLVRVSRGESDRYLPDPETCIPGKNGIVHTFENIVFAISAEGVSCWIKPREGQIFLQEQFKQRFDSIYYYLYLLSIHQRYALVNLGMELDRAAPSLFVMQTLSGEADEANSELLKSTDALYGLRAEVANFYLRAFFQQPVSLTNHQTYYQVLQDQLGIESLLNEVQHATTELEYLISNLQEHKSAKFQNEQLQHMVEHSNNELVLTLVVEGAALPYYSFGFFSHAFHLDDTVAMTISVIITILTMGYTIFKFKKKPKTNTIVQNQ